MTDQASGIGPASALGMFSRATSIRERGPATFDAEVSGDWLIAGRPNGGYLLAFLGRAATALIGSGHVIASSAHFLRSPEPGPVEIEGELLRRGREISQVRVRMSQGGRPCVEALMGVGELDPSAPPRWDAGAPEFEPVPFDDCLRLPPFTPDGQDVPMLKQVDMRLEHESIGGMASGRPSGHGQIRGWIELLDGEDFDPISLLFAVDAFPPATFDTPLNTMAYTVELTTYVRAVPAPGPVRVVCKARLIDPRCADETCDIWDSTGRLVAQAVQLTKVSA